ncbi:MAG: 4Fe-4S binding protein [Candidatus Hadarchaeota archaeon]
MTRKMLIEYSPQRAAEPVLSSVIKETGLLFNILYAEFDSAGGKILLAVDAPNKEVDAAIELFRKKGVELREIKQAIQLDRKSCMDCGACLSLCPTGALHLTGDNSIDLDEDKCIYCELCLPSCPVRALELQKF